MYFTCIDIHIHIRAHIQTYEYIHVRCKQHSLPVAFCLFAIMINRIVMK